MHDEYKLVSVWDEKSKNILWIDAIVEHVHDQNSRRNDEDSALTIVEIRSLLRGRLGGYYLHYLNKTT